MLAVAVVVASVVTGAVSASRPGLGLPLFGILAVVVGYTTVRWAASRFWAAVVIVFASRPGLDYFKSGEAALPAEPSTVLGMVILCASAVWLYRRWRSGLPIVSSRSSLAFVALAGVCVLSSVTSDAPTVSFQAALRVVSTAVMLIVLEQALRDRPDRLPGLLVATFASMIVPAFTAALQLQGNVPEVPLYGPALDVGRIQGTFVHPNVFAAYLTMLFPVAVALLPHVRRFVRVGIVTVAGASGFLLFFTYARGAWAAAFVGVMLIGWLQDRRLIWLVIAGTAVVLLAVPSAASRLADLGGDSGSVIGDPDSLSWRIQYWQDVLPFTSDGPITGIGLNVVERRTAYKLPPHNVFVQAVVETGAAGLLALVAFFLAVTFELRRALRALPAGINRGVVVGAAAAFAAFVVQCSSENLLAQPVVQWYLCVPLAWALSRNPAWQVRIATTSVPEPATHP
ncbi:MAG TPA: O-antigen ligase family protein [Acidimicrobiales bacterium]|nr:O-antigen ligase family protein [Acidimicrobiales bacterium]